MNLSCRLLLFLLIFKVSVSLGDNTREGKITGGYEAQAHSNPYVVSLQSRFLWFRYRLCTGSILSQRWILSAGHCVTDSWAKWFSMDAIVGAHDLAKISSSQIYPISHRIAHPMYRGGVGPYDIAMMRTSRKMQFSRTVQPISLPVTNPEFRKNEELLITGWGALQSSLFLSELPNKLHEVEVTYLPYNECYQAVDGIKDKYEVNPLKQIANICTGPITGGIAGCTGDSGGPLVQFVPYSSVDDTTPAGVTDKEETTTITAFTMSPTPMTTDRPSTMTTGSTASPTPITTDRLSTTTTMASTSVLPTTTAPTTMASITVAPTIAAPTTVAPATATPTTAASTTMALTTVASTTAASTTAAPTTTAPTTSAPTTIAASTTAETTIAATTTAATIMKTTTIAATATVAITTPATTTAESTTAATTTAANTSAATMTDAATASASRKRLWHNSNTSGANNGNTKSRRRNNLRILRTDMMPRIVGVLSWGVVPCGDKGAPTVYSNVTNYMDFINKYLHSS